jgi:hypothetical protein
MTIWRTFNHVHVVSATVKVKSVKVKSSLAEPKSKQQPLAFDEDIVSKTSKDSESCPDKMIVR